MGILPHGVTSITRRRQFTFGVLRVVIPFVLALLVLGSIRSSSAPIKSEIRPQATTVSSRTVPPPRLPSKPKAIDDLEGLRNEPIKASTSSGSVEPTMPQSGGSQVNVNFDSLTPGQNVETLFPNIRFSSFGHSVKVYAGNIFEFRNAPNSISRFGFGDFPDHFANLTIDFPQPVNNVSFYIAGVDSIFGSLALLDYSKTGSPTIQNLQIGTAGFHQLRQVQINENGIKQIVV